MAVQRGRSERGAEAYPLGYVEGPRDARTKLAVFFSILLHLELRFVQTGIDPSATEQLIVPTILH